MSKELHRTQRLLGEAVSNLAAVQEQCNQLTIDCVESATISGKLSAEVTKYRCYLHGALKLGLEKDPSAFQFFKTMFDDLDKEFGK